MAQTSIHADLHVFGSTRGYGTVVASRSVRDDEKRELESFQFGEASTSDRIARLATHAVMTGRALRSGRFAISRMMPAGIDDAGRPTVEVITLLINGRDYERCTGALPMLASDADLWRKARAEAASGMSIAAVAGEVEPSDPQVMRIFDLWRAASSAGAIGVVSESDSDAVLRMVASLDPADRLRCNWGIGLLSISTSADICSVAPGISMHGARDVMRLARDGAWHCGSESEYAAFRVMNGARWLPSIAEIETNGRPIEIATGGGSAPTVGSDAISSRSTHYPPRRERPLLPFAIGSAVLSTFVLAVAIGMFVMRDRPTIQPQSGGSEPQTVQPVQTPDEMSGPVPTAEEAPPSEQEKEDKAAQTGAVGNNSSDTPAGGSKPSDTPADGSKASGTPADGGKASGTPADGSKPSSTPAGGSKPSGTPADAGSGGSKSSNGGATPSQPAPPQAPQPTGGKPQEVTYPPGGGTGSSGSDTKDPTLLANRLLTDCRDWLGKQQPLKVPVLPAAANTPDGQRKALNLELARAKNLGPDFASRLAEILRADRDCKEQAKEASKVAAGTEWTMVEDRNGFVCVDDDGPWGKSQDDGRLNLNRLKLWVDLLEAWEKLIPKEQRLADELKQGVKDFQDRLKPTSTDKWKRAAAALLDENELNRELKQARKALDTKQKGGSD